MQHGAGYFFNLGYNFSLFQVRDQNKLLLQNDKGDFFNIVEVNEHFHYDLHKLNNYERLFANQTRYYCIIVEYIFPFYKLHKKRAD